MPTVDADVLATLARTPQPMSARRVHELCGRSYSQVHTVLNRLVRDGLVEVERYGTTGAYRLNRDHVLCDAVLAMCDASIRVEALIADAARAFDPPPALVAIFGSFARRDGDAESDIDVLLVRPDRIPGDDVSWSTRRYDLIQRVEAASGNPVQVVELDEREWQEARRTSQPLVASLRRDAVVLFGDGSTLGRPTPPEEHA